LGTALALEEILEEIGKKVHLYCPVDIPKYLRYAKGWDRVSGEFNHSDDLYIIVDTASKTLLDKALTPENLAQLEKKPTIVLDHHKTESDLPFEHILVSEPAVATSELLFKIALENNWQINPQAAENMLLAMLSDSLGLTSEAITAESLQTVTDLVKHGASIATIEAARREYMKKSARILEYKGRLLQRVEYYLEGQLALVHVPWEEIEEYSDAYNPGALVIDEMRLVENVKLAVVLKTYPDGKLTGKLRANPEAKIAESVAGYFGGGGHPYAAGFRVFEEYDKIVEELITATDKALKEYEAI
jgi:phosphoesterase RecJ-like protein